MTGKRLLDFEGREVSLTAERREHILEHPEMADLDAAIEETLLDPVRVVQSASDIDVHLYYRFYFRTVVGGKYLCVVVKMREKGSFVLTAYLTKRMKKGVILWPNRGGT
ncbi:MAG TPA: hypothetical protein VGQ46_20875 [Thermoanaerobaculia bacterium]|nr:hypothetical protein [Thermoanaerobaculia bacterium]